MERLTLDSKLASYFLCLTALWATFWKPHVILAFLWIYYTSTTLFPVSGPSEISKNSTLVLQAVNDWMSPSSAKRQLSLSTRQT